MRSLTVEEHEIAEKIKLGVLFNIEPFSAISEDRLKECFNTPLDSHISQKINLAVSDVGLDLNKKLTVAELHKIYTDIYTELYYDSDN
jgi:hypothetical protein